MIDKAKSMSGDKIIYACSGLSAFQTLTPSFLHI